MIALGFYLDYQEKQLDYQEKQIVKNDKLPEDWVKEHYFIKYLVRRYIYRLKNTKHNAYIFRKHPRNIKLPKGMNIIYDKDFESEVYKYTINIHFYKNRKKKIKKTLTEFSLCEHLEIHGNGIKTEDIFEDGKLKLLVDKSPKHITYNSTVNLYELKLFFRDQESDRPNIYTKIKNFNYNNFSDTLLVKEHDNIVWDNRTVNVCWDSDKLENNKIICNNCHPF